MQSDHTATRSAATRGVGAFGRSRWHARRRRYDWAVRVAALTLVCSLETHASGVDASGGCEPLQARVAALEREVATLRARLGARDAATPVGFAKRTAWQDASSWRRLKRGMSRYEVMGILGEPGKMVAYEGFERWEYPDLRGGRVSFDERGILGSWRAPPPGQ